MNLGVWRVGFPVRQFFSLAMFVRSPPVVRGRADRFVPDGAAWWERMGRRWAWSCWWSHAMRGWIDA